MPFTFSHPAIVLPLSKISRNKISMTGLIIGSMSPDFEYFIRMELGRVHGHNLDAIFWYNLPICCVVAIVYHTLIKKQLILHLPHTLSSRLNDHSNINWMKWLKKHWFVFVYSVIIGVLSHLIWDAFTHASSAFGSNFDFLKQRINIGGNSFFIFSLLQFFSSLFGLMYIMKYIISMPLQPTQHIDIYFKINYWTRVLMTGLFIYLVKAPETSQTIIATLISGGIIGILVSSLISTYYEKLYQSEIKQL